ncbi:MAG: hypothetical protein AB1778_03140, partial [Candidatus Bipolaricaulota bacterium]
MTQTVRLSLSTLLRWEALSRSVKATLGGTLFSRLVSFRADHATDHQLFYEALLRCELFDPRAGDIDRLLPSTWSLELAMGRDVREYGSSIERVVDTWRARAAVERLFLLGSAPVGFALEGRYSEVRVDHRPAESSRYA